MCTYNGAAYLREQLDSIVVQTRRPDRLVIVDDHSSDESVEIARAFADVANFPVEVSVNQHNLGYAKNFERAIELSQGDLIALSDQDDVWRPLKLEKIAATFDSSPSTGLVFSDAELVRGDLSPLDYRVWPAVRFSQASQAQVCRGEAFEVLLRGNIVTCATMAFRSTFKDLVLPIEGGLHDAWIALLISAVADVTMLPEPLIDYRQHPSNQIGARKSSRLRRLSAAKRLQRSELRRLESAAKRLVEHGGVSAERLALLDEMIAHLAIRIELPERRVLRLRSISRDLWTGRYRRLWGTSRSALHDLVAS
ncbi:hypothetical protein BH24GEM2_BH24GEM2_11160 [soil metagenome]